MRTWDMAVPDSSHDFVELVWENGTLLTKGRRNPNNVFDISSSAYTRFPINDDLVGCEEEDEASEEKVPRLGSRHSIFPFPGADSRPNSDHNSRLYQAPTSLLQPRFDSNHGLLPANGFFKQSSGSPGEEMRKVNFSHFFGLNSPINNTDNGQGIRSSRNRITPAKVESDHRVNMKPSSEDKNLQIGCQKPPIRVGMETETEAVKAVPPSFMAGGGDSLVPDGHSQATGNNFIEDHFIHDATFDYDHQVPGQDSSIEASNASPSKLKRVRFDESESTYQDEDEEEDEDEMEDRKRRTFRHGSGSIGTKRSRSAMHNLSEKKRRDRINKRMRALQELLPNCNKVDKASVLDEAIEYMKTLQLQLQIMSTGNRLFTSPMTMLPPGIHQLSMPYLNQFPLVSAGMGMRMGPGFVQGPAHQFPLPGPSPASLAGGFQPMGCIPYIPVLGDHPAFTSLMNGADFSRAAAAIIEQMGSIPMSGSDNLNKNEGYSEVGQKPGM